jgi:CheY-like chemotaxis protein
VELVLNLDPELPEIYADPDQLIQVFTNLIVNARQAMATVDGPKRLTVASSHDQGAKAVRIAVADTGPGVPDALQSRIFEPFFTTKTVGEGIGLGLSLSHNIVRAHGGTIGVEPAPGGGSVFTILLPLGTVDEQTLPEEGQGEAVTGEPGRILIVDDALDVAELLGDILRGAGHRIDTAESGRAALRKLDAADFDLIFCDLRMPELDGPGLYAELEDSRPALAARMIFITGDSLSEGAKRFLETCGRPFIEKPFIPDEIRRLTAAMLRRGAEASGSGPENSHR